MASEDISRCATAYGVFYPSAYQRPCTDCRADRLICPLGRWPICRRAPFGEGFIYTRDGLLGQPVIALGRGPGPCFCTCSSRTNKRRSSTTAVVPRHPLPPRLFWLITGAGGALGAVLKVNPWATTWVKPCPALGNTFVIIANSLVAAALKYGLKGSTTVATGSHSAFGSTDARPLGWIAKNWVGC